MKKFIKKRSWLYSFTFFFYTKFLAIYHGLPYKYGNRKKIVSKYYKKMRGFKPNLENPQRFTEKITWLKVYWRDPLAVKCVDKYKVREIVEERIGKEYLNELYGVYDSVDEIDWNDLPDKFIMKLNNGCGNHVICEDKSNLNVKESIRTLKRGMITKHHYYSFEWTYEGIKPKIICEKLLYENGKLPLDYKIFCSEGKPKFLFITSGRADDDVRFDFYDLEFNHLPVMGKRPNSDFPLSKPKNFEKMLELAAKLSEGFPQVRVDFYNINGQIIFGELTFFSGGGVGYYTPDHYDYIFGELIDFPLNKYYNIYS